MPLTDKLKWAGWRKVLALHAAAAVTVCFLSGCERGKSRLSDLRRFITRKSAAPAAPAAPTYNRYYTIWWISHSNLKTGLREGQDQIEIEHLFIRTIQNLAAMSKFLDNEKKGKARGFISEYEELRHFVKPGRPGRRTMSRLDRLSTRIKRNLSPSHVEVGGDKGEAGGPHQ